MSIHSGFSYEGFIYIMVDVYMENEESQEQEQENGNRLHAIERSRLRGAQQSRAGAKQRQAQRRTKRDVNERVERERPKRKRKPRSGKKVLIFFMFIAILVLFLLTTVFSTARLGITLSSISLPIDGVFAAIREPAQSKDITYRQFPPPITIVREASIANVIREQRNTRADGTVVLYNGNPSGEDLSLRNRTRLRAADGRIYRIIGKQVIPGGKTSGGSFVPGSKEVKIEADAVGKTYDLLEIGTSLSIPGLYPRYKEHVDTHAVTKTKVVGGFSGERLIPDADEAATVREQLRRDIEKALRDSLAQSLANNSLSERIVFDEGVFITFESLDDQQKDDKVVILEEGTLYAVSFREIELASLLVKYASPSAQLPMPPARVETKGLSMEIEKRDEFDVVSSTEFSFRLSGSAKLFWDIDEALFLGDIVGKTRTEVNELITGEYSQVKKLSDLSIFPAWRTSLPGNEKKIEVKVGY